jgi:hypothetical protein
MPVMSENTTTKCRRAGRSRWRATPGPGRGPRRWAWRLFSAERQELLALALIITAVAAGWLLARH